MNKTISQLLISFARGNNKTSNKTRISLDAKITSLRIISIKKLIIYINIYAFTNRLCELASKKGDKAILDS